MVEIHWYTIEEIRHKEQTINLIHIQKDQKNPKNLVGLFNRFTIARARRWVVYSLV